MKCKTPLHLNDKQSWPLAQFLVAVFFSSKDDVDKIQLQYSDLQKTSRLGTTQQIGNCLKAIMDFG